jgi:fused signal recognition particle receptor
LHMGAFFRRPDKKQDEGSPAGDKGFFQRLRQGLGKTRSTLTGRLDRLFLGKKEITPELLDEMEEILFTSDMGVATTRELIDSVQAGVARKTLTDPEALKRALREQILAFLEVPRADHPLPAPGDPLVVMAIGVNGVGKTTTIGKAAHQFKARGKTVLLVAADTFRAAAVEQLAIWGERVGADVVKQGTGADPSAVVFDALTAAVSRKADVVLIDTAGRLHTKINLMEELQKIQRVAGRRLPGAPHEVWLVLDATTGQNAISQAEMFHKALGITDIVLTKLDGTAKGGIVVGIARQLKIPVRYIGIGEKLDDLRPFDPSDFVEAIFD